MDIPAIIPALARKYFELEVVPASVCELSGGEINRNFKLQCVGGKLAVFRVYPSSRRRRQIEFEMNTLLRLHELDSPVPRPWRNRKGEFHQENEGYAWVLLDYIQGSALPESNLESSQILAAIDCFLAVESALREIENPFRPVSELRVFSSHLDSLWSRMDSQGFSGLRLEAQSRLNNWQQRVDESRLSSGIVHGDLRPQNFISSATTTSLIDFDDAHVGIRRFDRIQLAHTLSWAARDSEEHSPKALLKILDRSGKGDTAVDEAITGLILVKTLAYLDSPEGLRSHRALQALVALLR